MTGDIAYIIGFVGGLSVKNVYDIIKLLVTISDLQSKYKTCRVGKHN